VLGAWFYSRGISNEIPDRAKYLNSGCIIGRAKEVYTVLLVNYLYHNKCHIIQIKELISSIYEDMSLVRDDQQVFVRYFLSHPELISVDVHNNMFLCAYKEPLSTFNGFKGDGSMDLTITTSNIGLVHCNNRVTDNYYHR
jgi:hypothetical protein